MVDQPAVEPPPRVRVDWMDVARGLGIILVVIGHAERGLVSAGMAGGSMGWLDYTLYLFHMPLFFLLSGLNVPHALRKGAASFTRSKLHTIAYPYVLWSLVQGGVLVALSGVTNGSASLSDLAQIGWRPMGQFWFLYVLFFCQFVALATSGRRLVLAALGVAAYLTSLFLSFDILVERGLYSFAFFALGVLLSERIGKMKPLGLVVAISAVVAFAAMAGLAFAISPVNYHHPAALPATVLGITATLLIARSMSDGRIKAALVALGGASMTIYVAHILVTGGVRILFAKAHVEADPWVLLAVISTAGVGLPFVFHLVLSRPGLLPWLGLAPAPRRTPPGV